MKVFVTGSSGFVGSHIVKELQRAGGAVYGFDREPPLPGASLDEYIAGDVADGDGLAAAVRRIRPEAIVHCAAVTPAIDELPVAREILLVNVQSTMTLLEAAAGIRCEKFVYLSSAGVYRDPEPGTALTEESSVDDGGSLYAQTKLASERLLIWARRVLGMITTSLRVGPVYGEFERPTTTRSRMSPLYRAVHLARNGDVLSCNSWDSTLNFIHGDDVGRAILAVQDADSPGQTYNVAGAPVSMRETAEAIAQLYPETRVDWSRDVSDPTLPIRLPDRPVSSALIARDLGVTQGITLLDGISRVMDAGTLP